ncbi:MAG: hypothetical protein HYY84_11075 [Deltaproteobacteria bacterium]|nr:hypothetical protein [Deltaproteobacteria bacterium]
MSTHCEFCGAEAQVTKSHCENCHTILNEVAHRELWRLNILIDEVEAWRERGDLLPAEIFRLERQYRSSRERLLASRTPASASAPATATAPATAPASAPAKDFNAKAQRSEDAKNETSSRGDSAPLRQIPAPEFAVTSAETERTGPSAISWAILIALAVFVIAVFDGDFISFVFAGSILSINIVRSFLRRQSVQPPAPAPAEDFNAKAQRSEDARNETSSRGDFAPLRQIPAPAPASATADETAPAQNPKRAEHRIEWLANVGIAAVLTAVVLLAEAHWASVAEVARAAIVGGGALALFLVGALLRSRTALKTTGWALVVVGALGVPIAVALAAIASGARAQSAVVATGGALTTIFYALSARWFTSKLFGLLTPLTVLTAYGFLLNAASAPPEAYPSGFGIAGLAFAVFAWQRPQNRAATLLARLIVLGSATLPAVLAVRGDLPWAWGAIGFLAVAGGFAVLSIPSAKWAVGAPLALLGALYCAFVTFGVAGVVRDSGFAILGGAFVVAGLRDGIRARARCLGGVLALQIGIAMAITEAAPAALIGVIASIAIASLTAAVATVRRKSELWALAALVGAGCALGLTAWQLGANLELLALVLGGFASAMLVTSHLSVFLRRVSIATGVGFQIVAGLAVFWNGQPPTGWEGIAALVLSVAAGAFALVRRDSRWLYFVAAGAVVSLIATLGATRVPFEAWPIAIEALLAVPFALQLKKISREANSLAGLAAALGLVFGLTHLETPIVGVTTLGFSGILWTILGARLGPASSGRMRDICALMVGAGAGAICISVSWVLALPAIALTPAWIAPASAVLPALLVVLASRVRARFLDLPWAVIGAVGLIFALQQSFPGGAQAIGMVAILIAAASGLASPVAPNFLRGVAALAFNTAEFAFLVHFDVAPMISASILMLTAFAEALGATLAGERKHGTGILLSALVLAISAIVQSFIPRVGPEGSLAPALIAIGLFAVGGWIVAGLRRQTYLLALALCATLSFFFIALRAASIDIVEAYIFPPVAAFLVWAAFATRRVFAIHIDALGEVRFEERLSRYASGIARGVAVRLPFFRVLAILIALVPSTLLGLSESDTLHTILAVSAGASVLVYGVLIRKKIDALLGTVGLLFVVLWKAIAWLAYWEVLRNAAAAWWFLVVGVVLLTTTAAIELHRRGRLRGYGKSVRETLDRHFTSWG